MLVNQYAPVEMYVRNISVPGFYESTVTGHPILEAQYVLGGGQAYIALSFVRG
jgi:hypothetical protein